MLSPAMLLLIDPRSLDDFFSPDLLQEAIGRDRWRNNPYFLPTFVQRSLMALHSIDPLIDAFLTRSFAECHPEKERLLVALHAVGHFQETLRAWIGGFRDIRHRRLQFGLQTLVVL